MEFEFVPIYSLGRGRSEDTFDESTLPFEIADGIAIEDISKLLAEGAFELWEKMLGEYHSRQIRNVQYAWVDRHTSENESEHIPLTFVGACARLIRPMRQGILVSARGQIRDADGKFEIRGFDTAEMYGGVEVVKAHKLNTLRNRDAEELREILPEFNRALTGEFWKFRMAVEFHDRGYLQSYNWKPRFLLWCSALEALFTSHGRDHQGSRVAIARIKYFLGEATNVYPQSDMPHEIPSCNLSIGYLIEDLYEMRNYIAHGDKLPDRYFKTYPREGIDEGVTLADVLSEAASFIIRKSLKKILRENLLEHFADAVPAEAYFGAQGLTNYLLPRS